jgi:hypothetical protein
VGRRSSGFQSLGQRPRRQSVVPKCRETFPIKDVRRPENYRLLLYCAVLSGWCTCLSSGPLREVVKYIADHCQYAINGSLPSDVFVFACKPWREHVQVRDNIRAMVTGRSNKVEGANVVLAPLGNKFLYNDSTGLPPRGDA